MQETAKKNEMQKSGIIKLVVSRATPKLWKSKKSEIFFQGRNILGHTYKDKIML